MYHNIINFLLGRTKKNLSKQEADDLMRLIAQSIGLEDEYKEKTDDKSFIKRMLDEVIIEENTGEEEFCGALDDIFDFEEDSYEYAEDYEDHEEMFEGVQPLNKRKISRKNVFRRVKKSNVRKDDHSVKNLVHKDESTKAGTKKDDIKDLDNTQDESVKKDESNNIRDTDDKKMSNQQDMNNGNDNNSNINNGNDIVNKTSTESKDKEIDTTTQQIAFNLSKAVNLPKVVNLSKAVNHPNTSNQPKTFNLPNTSELLDNSEFTFEIEPLESVNNTGPPFKFLDENGDDF